MDGELFDRIEAQQVEIERLQRELRHAHAEIAHLRTAGTALAEAIHHADWCPAWYGQGGDCDDECGVAAAVTAWMRSGGHA